MKNHGIDLTSQRKISDHQRSLSDRHKPTHTTVPTTTLIRIPTLIKNEHQISSEIKFNIIIENNNLKLQTDETKSVCSCVICA